jgi:hypothetical protein
VGRDADAGLSRPPRPGEPRRPAQPLRAQLESAVPAARSGLHRRWVARWRGVQACGLRCTKWWRATW